MKINWKEVREIIGAFIAVGMLFGAAIIWIFALS